MYIDSRFEADFDDTWRDVLSPVTEKVITRESEGGEADVNRAVVVAREVRATWERLLAVKRDAYLHRIAQGMCRRASELIDTIVAGGGKTGDLAHIETMFTVDYLDYQIEWARRYEGEIIQGDRPRESILLFKRPLDMIAGILSWNFPLFLTTCEVGPVLITGNAIVVKPSSATSINCHIFAEIVHAPDLPAGISNVVNDLDAEVDNASASRPQAGIVGLTGSVEAGHQATEATATNTTKVSLEFDGKTPAIVPKNAGLDLAMKSILASRVSNIGQICNCAEYMYVHSSLKDTSTEKVVVAAKDVHYSNPAGAEPDALEIGLLTKGYAVKAITKGVERAVEQGAILVCGGRRANDKGYFFEPTLLTDTDDSMGIIREETFDPILPAITFDTLGQVIVLTNDNEFDLTSSVCTVSLDETFYVARRLRFDETYISRENSEAMRGPRVGWKKSGVGDTNGRHGLEEYLQTQVVYLETDT